MKIIGHRGAMGLEPENTLRSFRKALSIGVDGIEFDVHILPSGELVVIHDSTVDRTTNGHGKIASFSFGDIRKLDAGNGEKIPTIEEVLNLIDKKVPVNIELKSAGTAEPVSKVIQHYIKNRGWRSQDFEVHSFSVRRLREFKKLMPGIETALCVSHKLPFARLISRLAVKICGFPTVNSSLKITNRKYVNRMHGSSCQVFVFTVNSKDDIKNVAMLGVDGIHTNFPDLATDVLRG